MLCVLEELLSGVESFDRLTIWREWFPFLSVALYFSTPLLELRNISKATSGVCFLCWGSRTRICALLRRR